MVELKARLHCSFSTFPEPLCDGFLLFSSSMVSFRQAAKGMAYLEGADIVHRDVAARNVFIGENLLTKIGNFEHCIEGQSGLLSQNVEELQYKLSRRVS